ncbi:hypothetical protein ABPG72_018027 [Tetrahymena utriculariae]
MQNKRIYNIFKQNCHFLFRRGILYNFCTSNVEKASIISSKINLQDISPNIDTYDKLLDYYSLMISNQNIQQSKKFEIDYYNEICAKQLQSFLKNDETKYQAFLTTVLQKKDINHKCLHDLIKLCGHNELFPSNQKLIMQNILEKKQEEFQRLIRKSLSYLNLYFKIFIVGYLISFAYRAYYYFEYDISIYHPRATAWHVYRFR